MRVPGAVRFTSMDDDFFPPPPAPRAPAASRAPERSLRVPSSGEWAAAAGAVAGIRVSGCGRFRRSARCPSSVNGRRRGSRSLASRSIQRPFAMPRVAHMSCSQTRPRGLGAPLGLAGSAAYEPAANRTETRSAKQTPLEAPWCPDRQEPPRCRTQVARCPGDGLRARVWVVPGLGTTSGGRLR
jgi:hypothetical protein